MQNVHSTPDTQHQVDTFLASLPLDGSVAAAELIRAIKTNELTPNLVLAVAGFLANAPATLLAILLIAPGASAADIENMISSAVALADKVHCERASTLEVEIKRALIPSDFPAQPQAASISGAQPKIALVSYGGKYYEPGTSPPEVLARWELCEDLANQFVERCLLSEKGKYAHLSHQEILQQYLERLLRTGWGSDADMTWVIHRTADLLSWAPISDT